MSSPVPPSRFIVVLSVISVATIVVTTALLLMQLYGRELRHAEAETVSLGGIIAEQTTRALQSVDLALNVALDRLQDAERQGIPLSDPAIHAMLESRVVGMPHVHVMFVVDAGGTVLNSSRTFPALRRQVADRDYFKVPQGNSQGGLFVGSAITTRTDGTWTLHFSRAMRKKNGEFGGVVVAALDLKYFESLYDSIKLDTIGTISLYLSDGTLMACQPHDATRIGKKISLPTAPIQETKSGLSITTRSEGENPGVITYRRIRDFPLILAVGTHDDDALDDWREFAHIIIANAAMWILLLLGAAYLLMREQLREAAALMAARESGERLAAVVDAAMDAMITADGEQKILLFNPAAERMFGYTSEQAIGSPLDLLLPELYPAEGGGVQRGGVAPAKSSVTETVGSRADGSKFPVEMTIARVNVEGQMLSTAILRDISRRYRREAELRQSHQQLRELATVLQTVREEERTSIARELHDELGQQLMRLNMDLSWLTNRLKTLSPALHERVVGMKHIVEGTVDTVRRVTTQLRPLLLDDLGLADAIRWQLEDFTKRTGIAINASVSIDDTKLEPRIATNAFRILQETLTNVARHAEASQVNVRISQTENSLNLELADNGRGANLSVRNPHAGYGLVCIRERALSLGGKSEISSAPGQGLTVKVDIPLHALDAPGVQA